MQGKASGAGCRLGPTTWPGYRAIPLDRPADMHEPVTRRDRSWGRRDRYSWYLNI
jgi:hypothetical protein